MDNNTEVIQDTQTEERTFTQAELNAIVQKRLGEHAAKFGKYEELKEKAQKFDEIEDKAKTELQKVTERADLLQKELDAMKQAETVRLIREDVSKQYGVPTSLLKGGTKEECEEQAKDILSFAKPNKYPSVKDAGEVQNISGGTTRDQFASWLQNSNGGN